jgi:hypothetical protein
VTYEARILVICENELMGASATACLLGRQNFECTNQTKRVIKSAYACVIRNGDKWRAIVPVFIVVIVTTKAMIQVTSDLAILTCQNYNTLGFYQIVAVQARTVSEMTSKGARTACRKARSIRYGG